jgi:hypothetical protein
MWGAVFAYCYCIREGCYTRVSQSNWGDTSELDFVNGNKLDRASFVSSSTENAVVGMLRAAPFISSDHRSVRVAVRVADVPVCPYNPNPVRWVHYETASEQMKQQYGAELAELLYPIVDGLDVYAMKFNGQTHLLERAITTAIALAEDSQIGASMRTRRSSDATSHIEQWITPETRTAELRVHDLKAELDALRGSYVRRAANGEAVLDADAVFATSHDILTAASEQATALRRRDVAIAAHSGMLGNPKRHVMERLHQAIRWAFDRAPRRGYGGTHEFNVLERSVSGASDSDLSDNEMGESVGAVESRFIFGADVDEYLCFSMHNMHEIDPFDDRFDMYSHIALVQAHAAWERYASEPESQASRQPPGDGDQTDFWLQFDARVANGERPLDAEWQQRIAADITMEEVKKAVAAMQANTAASPGDGIQPSALIHGGEDLYTALALLFTCVLETGEVPEVWTIGYVRWLPKGGSELNWLNFRGIVLTSSIGKTFERVLLARLTPWVRNVGGQSHLQAGSNPPLGVLHQIHLVHSAAALRAESNLPTFILLIDIKRAFPSTTRALVYQCLRDMGMGGATLRAVDGLFANTVRLSVGGGVGYTEPVRRDLGVPEGYVLSPLFFTLVIAKLMQVLEASGHGIRIGADWCGAVAFVDDIVLLAESIKTLQMMSFVVAEWCWRQRYVLSMDKCELVCLGPNCDTFTGRVFTWTWTPLLTELGHTLSAEQVAAATVPFTFKVKKAVKYLGVTLTTDLQFDQHTKNNIGGARGQLQAARESVAVLQGMRRSHAFIGYSAYARTYVEWAAGAFGAISPTGLRRLDRLQRDFGHLILGITHEGVAAHLLGDLPGHLRRATLHAQFLCELMFAAHAFPERGRIYAALDRGQCTLSPPFQEAMSALGMNGVDIDPTGVVNEPGAALGGIDHVALRHAKTGWMERVRSAAWGIADHQLTLAGGAPDTFGAHRLNDAWRERWVLEPSVRDKGTSLMFQILADEWSLVPVFRLCRSDWCDLCQRWRKGDIEHVLLNCPCRELREMRDAWEAAIAAEMDEHGMGAWWAGLPRTLSGRGAVMMGHIAMARPDVADWWRDRLTGIFMENIGKWWESLGDEPLDMLMGGG